MSGIAEALDDLKKPITALHPHPQNPRRGDVEAIKESLEEFGQVRPIVALPDGTIVAGHHVFYAAQELQWSEIAVVTPALTREQARRYLIADNRLAELGSYDQDALAGLLQEIVEAGQLTGTGYTQDDVADLMADMDTEIEAEAEDMGPSPEETAEEIGRGPDDGDQPREVVLMLRPDEFDELGEHVRKLKEAYGLDATTAVICEAVRREALRF